MLVSRTPVVRTDLSVYGFELTVRPPARTLGPEPVAEALSRVFTGSEPAELFDGLLGFVSISPALLEAGFEVPFPPGVAVVQLDGQACLDPRLAGPIGRLAEQGHLLAIERFIPAPAVACVLGLMHLVKIDVRQQPWDLVLGGLELAAEHGVRARVATRVGGKDIAGDCQAAGFTLLQGPYAGAAQTLPWAEGPAPYPAPDNDRPVHRPVDGTGRGPDQGQRGGPLQRESTVAPWVMGQ